eukprot:g17175.t1
MGEVTSLFARKLVGVAGDSVDPAEILGSVNLDPDGPWDPKLMLDEDEFYGMLELLAHKMPDATALPLIMLAEETRRELAKGLLRDEQYTLADIAFLTGFSEQSAFTRAFKRKLETLGHAVRRGSRSSVIPFDWEDSSTWAPALEGVRAAYITYFPDLAFPGAVEKLEALTVMAREAGVKKLVLLSGRGEHHARLGEDVVKASGVPFTIVRSAWFAQNFSEGYLRDPIMTGVLPMPGGDIREPIIDIDDIADVVVAALIEGSHDGELYEVTGPELLSFADMATELSNAISRPIQHLPISFEDFHASVAATSGTGGVEAMQVINREVFRWVFMVLFLGLAPLSLGISIYGLIVIAGTTGNLLALAGLTYFVGCFGVTVCFNVPLNERLAKMDLADAFTDTFWKETYVPRWTWWNSPLRERLIATGDLAQQWGISDIFDSYVDSAVRRFQARHGLVVDGVMGTEGFAAMNVPLGLRIRQLETNLVRIRSMSGFLGDRYVMVNIPAAALEAIDNGRVTTRHTAIVGKVDRPTPILDSRIHELNFNPFWTVPVSIIRRDLIPLMQENPNYLAENNIRIFSAWSSNAQELAPEQVDWNTEEATRYMFRQDPGEINSLGSVKINFHNEHQVYLHDTPDKSLFGDDYRFLSSGCVRVQNVRELVTWLLSRTDGWSRQRIDQVIQRGERIDVSIPDPSPLYINYVTAWAASDGTVNFREDIYNRDGLPTLASNG